MKKIFLAILALVVMSGCAVKKGDERVFIAHRGANMRYVAAGENSLESIRLAKRAGFKSIETDVRLTADSVLVVMHDKTLHRTCLNLDGSRVNEDLQVSDFTMDELKSNFVLRATKEEMRTQIPTLEEFLEVCKEEELLVFIEPKLKDSIGRHYLDIIECADSILGRENYIVTSNNFANTVIRNTLGIKDVRLMGILYQTTYEDIANQENIIMAISATRFSPDEYSANVLRAKEDGFITESHADKFEHFDMINNADIDYVSTDFLAPDWHKQGKLISRLNGRNLKHALRVSEKSLSFPEVEFGAIYLEMKFSGSAKIALANQEFEIASESSRIIKHQVLLSNMLPIFEIMEYSEDFNIDKISVKVVKF